MKVKVGRLQFETLTPTEARQIVGEELDNRFRFGDSIEAELVRAEESAKTDAAGLLVLPVYVVPPAMEFRTHVVVVEADGFTPAVPFNGAGSWWRLRVAGRSIDFASMVAAAVNGSQLPFSRGYGFMQGGVSLNQEPVELEINAGPVNTLIRCFIQGTLLTKPGRPAEQ